MPVHTEIRHFPYSPRQLFDLVADVKNYPEFLPWCRAARVLEHGNGYFTAELVISFKHITEQYTSRVHLTPPERDHSPAAIRVELVSGPFDHLDNRWTFEPAEDGGTTLHFHLDFAFKTRWLDKLIGGFFARATEKMVAAFSKRADALYRF